MKSALLKNKEKTNDNKEAERVGFKNSIVGTKVVLCIDLSGSMHYLMRSQKINNLMEMVVENSFLLDPNGNVDVFGFGDDAERLGVVNKDNLEEFSEKIKTMKTMGGTRYGNAIKKISKEYEKESGLTYVIFITDGDSTDKEEAKKEIEKTYRMPIFFQFIGIGGTDYFPLLSEKRSIVTYLLGADKINKRKKSMVRRRFKFLMDLEDNETGKIRNTGFFASSDPSESMPNKYLKKLMEKEIALKIGI